MAKPFSNEGKPFDRGRPFHRVHSRNFNLSAPKPDGRGLDCGCRNADDYSPTFLAALIVGGLFDALEGASGIDVPDSLKEASNALLKKGTGVDVSKEIEKLQEEISNWVGKNTEGLLFRSALRHVPAWVAVNRRITRAKTGKVYPAGFVEQEKEVEGLLSRSFLSTPHMVTLPWTRSWQWNFHVAVHPGNGFEHVIGPANRLNQSERDALRAEQENAFRPSFDWDDPEARGGGKIESPSFEVLWDTGAITAAPGNFGQSGEFPPGIMFNEAWPFWPMMNDTFWAQGRWVYDCTHFHERELASGETVEEMWTQIHPPRAFACSRLEGFLFDENTKRVPTARFFFLACRKGGYFDFGPFSKDAADDPEFILDLPPAPRAGVPTWTIGATPDFASNTCVIRPRLLTKVEFAPFGIGGTFLRENLFVGAPEPTLEPIKSDEALETADQLRVTVPLSKLRDGAQAYGFVLSAGWADPTGEQAARVKKVTVTLDDLRDLDKNGELRVRFAINGRWRHAVIHPRQISDSAASVAGSVTLFLPEDSTLALSVSGIKRRGYGQFLEEEPDAKRQLRVGGIFDLTEEELNEKIKKGEKKLTLPIDGVSVVIDTEMLKHLRKAVEPVLELLKARRNVSWTGDVDQKDDGIASAVARETYFKPVALFNARDEPLGLVDRVDRFKFGTERIARSLDGEQFFPEYRGDKITDVLKELADSGQRRATVQVRTFQTEVVGDAHLWAFRPPRLGDARLDYVFRFHVAVEEQ